MMQANPLADFLESRELELLCHWLQAFVKESPRYHHAVHAVSPDAFVIVFKQVLSLLRAEPDAVRPLGHSEVYIDGVERRHISDLQEILLSGEVILRKEILAGRTPFSFERAAEEVEQLNAAFHQMLEVHVAEFCSDCSDSLIEYCREINERAAHQPAFPRTTKPLHDPLECRCLAFPPPLEPHTNGRDTLVEFLRGNREEILDRWVSLLDDREQQRFRERVDSINGALSELLDEALASLACCTQRAPHLRNTQAPTDAAPNLLHVILAGEEAIAGLLRSLHSVIDAFWLDLRAHLNEAFHQLLRNNVTSECVRCRTLLEASRNRLRAMEKRAPLPSTSPILEEN